jgi:hypothetical protein
MSPFAGYAREKRCAADDVGSSALVGFQKPVFCRARVGRDVLEITARELTLCERRKDDAPDAFLVEDPGEPVFNPAIQHAIRWLMD